MLPDDANLPGSSSDPTPAPVDTQESYNDNRFNFPAFYGHPGIYSVQSQTWLLNDGEHGHDLLSDSHVGTLDPTAHQRTNEPYQSPDDITGPPSRIFVDHQAATAQSVEQFRHWESPSDEANGHPTTTDDQPPPPQHFFGSAYYAERPSPTFPAFSSSINGSNQLLTNAPPSGQGRRRAGSHQTSPPPPSRSPNRRLAPYPTRGSRLANTAGSQQGQISFFPSPSPPVGLLVPQSSQSLEVSHKLSSLEFAARMDLFNNREWFAQNLPTGEPPLTKESQFVVEGLVQPNDKSRFRAFIAFDPITGKYWCRISKDKNGPCHYHAQTPKEAIAHVREHLGYRPYKCEGTDRHEACVQMFLTTERRTDHYSRARRPAEEKVGCKFCKTKMWERNLLRHHRICRKKPSASMPS